MMMMMMIKSILQHALRRRGVVHVVVGGGDSGLHFPSGGRSHCISVLGPSAASYYYSRKSTNAAAAATTLCAATAAASVVSGRFFSSSSSSSKNNSDKDKDDDDDDVVYISIDEARNTTTMALRRLGWDDTDAALQAEIIMAAELRGNNQGLVKMYDPTQMAPKSNVTKKPVIKRNTSSSAVINANQSPGMLAAIMASDLAVQKLEDGLETGVHIAMVSSYNTSTSSGQLAFYVERMARHGYIGIALCNSPELVAAARGAKAVFGTNPLAVGIPLASSQSSQSQSSSQAAAAASGPDGGGSSVAQELTPFTVCMVFVFFVFLAFYS
jgi:Malate/L-lactate dehydrogenase